MRRNTKLTLVAAILTLFAMPVAAQQSTQVLQTFTACQPHSGMLNEMISKGMEPFLHAGGVVVTMPVPGQITPTRGVMETFMNPENNTYSVWLTIDTSNGAEEPMSCLVLAGIQIRPHSSSWDATPNSEEGPTEEKGDPSSGDPLDFITPGQGQPV